MNAGEMPGFADRLCLLTVINFNIRKTMKKLSIILTMLSGALLFSSNTYGYPSTGYFGSDYLAPRYVTVNGKVSKWTQIEELALSAIEQEKQIKEQVKKEQQQNALIEQLLERVSQLENQ